MAGKLLDDIVICVTVVLSLLIALFLAVALVQYKFGYPPTLITLFLGIAIAALTYRFLGGAEGTQFSVGLLKLGGSAALLLGTTFLVGSAIDKELDILNNSEAYRARIGALQKQLNDSRAENNNLAGQVNDLNGRLSSAGSSQVAYTLEQLKKLTPNDPLVRNIKALVAAKEPPFGDTLRSLALRVAVVQIPGDAAQYNICRDTFARLYEGEQAPNTNIILARSVGNDGEPVSLRLDRRGYIGEDVCSRADRNFDVQIGCSTANALFADMISNCAGVEAIRSQQVQVSALPS
jgi:hypothetical protein